MADLSAQIAEVRRELQRRDVIYPRMVMAGEMSREDADARVAAMKAVLATLLWATDVDRARRLISPDGKGIPCG